MQQKPILLLQINALQRGLPPELQPGLNVVINCAITLESHHLQQKKSRSGTTSVPRSLSSSGKTKFCTLYGYRGHDASYLFSSNSTPVVDPTKRVESCSICGAFGHYSNQCTVQSQTSALNNITKQSRLIKPWNDPSLQPLAIPLSNKSLLMTDSESKLHLIRLVNMKDESVETEEWNESPTLATNVFISWLQSMIIKHVALDLFGPFLKDTNGFIYTPVFIDIDNSHTMANALYAILGDYDFPKIIQFDHGLEVIGKIMSNLCHIAGFNHHFILAYYSHVNSAVM
ncbi:hypothetical protein QOT17_018778 [Balamuthia mandrillaris]